MRKKLTTKERELLQQIVTLSNELRMEREKNKKEYYDIESLFSLPDEIKAIYSSELANFLRNLTKEQLVLIAAVMYMGRNYRSCKTFEEYLDLFKKDEREVLLREIILEASEEYIELGIKALS